jgi:hypothetical protein
VDKIFRTLVFYARKRHVFPIAIGNLLDPRRNSMKPEGLFKKTARVAGVTRDVGSGREDGAT